MFAHKLAVGGNLFSFDPASRGKNQEDKHLSLPVQWIYHFGARLGLGCVCAGCLPA